jgi:dephospho-CoA kinase
LLFLNKELAGQESLWKSLGYEPRTGETLGVQAWQEAAKESQPEGTLLLFKQLRHDRVLRPI